MTADKLKEILEAKFGEKVTVSSLEPSDWYCDEHTGQTRREHLTKIFQRRLKGSLQHHGETPVTEEIRRFLGHLERYVPERQL